MFSKHIIGLILGIIYLVGSYRICRLHTYHRITSSAVSDNTNAYNIDVNVEPKDSTVKKRSLKRSTISDSSPSSKTESKPKPEEVKSWSLDFDDTVFDTPSAKNTASPVKGNPEDRDYVCLTNTFKRGDAVRAVVRSIGPLGASVRISIEKDNETKHSFGLILSQEVLYYEDANRVTVKEGIEMQAYVEKVRPDGKIDVTLRPIGYDKVLSGRDQIMKALENSPTGILNVGDKSPPDQVWDLFPGMSKSQFKAGVGLLLREGSVKSSADKLEIVPVSDRVPMPEQPYTGKAPKGWVPQDSCTLFIGNLPFSTDNMMLARAIEYKVGFGSIASVRVGTDPDTNMSRGFAHVDFLTSDKAKMALKALQGLTVDGREVRVDMKKRVEERPQREEPREWGDSSARGIRERPGGKTTSGSGGQVKGQRGTTAFVGNIAFTMTGDELKSLIESSLKDGPGAVTDVRINTDHETGQSKGYGFIDFVDVPTAERAVRELNGLQAQGRELKLDLEQSRVGARNPDTRDSDSGTWRRDRPSFRPGGGGGGGRGGRDLRGSSGRTSGRDGQFRADDSTGYGGSAAAGESRPRRTRNDNGGSYSSGRSASGSGSRRTDDAISPPSRPFRR